VDCRLANGLDAAAEALRILVNDASRIERVQRVDQANGNKPKTMLTP